MSWFLRFRIWVLFGVAASLLGWWLATSDAGSRLLVRRVVPSSPTSQLLQKPPDLAAPQILPDARPRLVEVLPHARDIAAGLMSPPRTALSIHLKEPDARVPLSANPPQAEGDSDSVQPAKVDVEIMGELLGIFARSTGAMPVGEDNAQITGRLTGRNPRGVAVIPSDHPAINERGELVDRWGTPYFFHAESASSMSVRSAGPDQRMWTPDDIVSDAL